MAAPSYSTSCGGADVPSLQWSKRTTSIHLLLSISMFLLFILPYPAGAVPYTFTKIDEDGPTAPVFHGTPTINDAGTVAFVSSRFHGSVQTGSGGPLTTLVTAGDLALANSQFTGFDIRPWINDHGEVAFRGFFGQFMGSGEGIFTVQDDHPTATVVTSLGAPFSSFGQPVLNSKESTAFFGFGFPDPGTPPTIFVAKGGVVTKLVDVSGNLSLQGPALISMNDKGDVAFLSGIKSGGEGVFVSNGGVIRKIADTSGRFTALGLPSINDKGQVAFWASLKSGGEAIFVARDNRLIRVADTRGEFASLRRPENLQQGFAAGYPVLSANGTVAFLATLDTGGSGIFSTCLRRACRREAPTEVIGIGDTLFGHTVSFLDLLDGGINDSGQIAFHAQEVTDVNGVNLASFDGIYRADPSLSPTPEPTTLLLFGPMAAGLGLAAWRRPRHA